MTGVSNYKLLQPITIGKDLVLKNRVFMSPMTRGRATDRKLTELNAQYYEQRTGAGLIFSEMTEISDQGYGWLGTPGMYDETHVEGWKKVVDRIHSKGSKTFVQLFHCGRRGHSSFTSSKETVSASAIIHYEGSAHTAEGLAVPYEVPRALEVHELAQIARDYRHAAELAKKAGFDGIDIHAGNGFLIDSFFMLDSNKRTDQYGVSDENRARFLMEVIEQVKQVYPSNRIGIHLSPNGNLGQPGSEDNRRFFAYLLEQLDAMDLAFVFVFDGMNADYKDQSMVTTIHDVRQHYKGTIIANFGYNRETAEKVLQSGAADAVAFATAYIANPDLAERFENDWPIEPNAPFEVFWDPSKGATGYIDYLPYEHVTN